MITPESLVAPSLEQTNARASYAALDRFARWLKTKAWIHALLLTMVAGCLYPVLWMFMTSVMTDEEVGRGDVFPSLPVYRARSPYVREAIGIAAPPSSEIDAARFASMVPALRDLALAAVSSAIRAQDAASIDVDAWAASAASVLANRAIDQIPRQAWSEPADALTDRYRALLTADAVGAALSDRLARIELASLTLRALDGHLVTIAKAGDPAPWKVVSGDGALTASGDAVRLAYRFESSSAEPLILETDFTLPEGMTPGDIHKLVLPIRADDSWHGVDATLDVGGTHWRSTRTTYLGQNRGQSLSFQPPSFDDTTIRARTWIPLRADGASDRTTSARLRVILTPSSRQGAIFAKIERNYLRAFDSVPFVRYVGNSLLLVALSIGGALFSSAFVAYAFSRLAWPGRSIALLLLLATMMVPPQVTMVPTFLIWRGLGWYNTLNPLWVPAWLGNGFFIFLMIQHMKTIPRELEEAARIDGLGVVQTWWYIIVPQLKPSLAAIAVMSFLGAWNEFMGPLLYLRDQSKFPLSLGLFGMRLDHGADWSMLMAANVAMTVPSVIAFFRFQRHLIEGITVTGMKG